MHTNLELSLTKNCFCNKPIKPVLKLNYPFKNGKVKFDFTAYEGKYDGLDYSIYARGKIEKQDEGYYLNISRIVFSVKFFENYYEDFNLARDSISCSTNFITDEKTIKALENEEQNISINAFLSSSCIIVGEEYIKKRLEVSYLRKGKGDYYGI